MLKWAFSMNKQDIKLIEFSISLYAKRSKRHTFINLHPRILESAVVIQSDWDLEEMEEGAPNPLITPGACSVAFKNGIRFYGDGDLVTISQTQDLEFGGTYLPPGIAVFYLRGLSPDVFFAADMNWSIEIPLKEPKSWLTRRFYNPDFISESWSNVETTPYFRFEVRDLMYSFAFLPTSHIREDCLSISAKVFSRSPGNDDYLTSWLFDNPEPEQEVLKNLYSFLELENDSN